MLYSCCGFLFKKVSTLLKCQTFGALLISCVLSCFICVTIRFTNQCLSLFWNLLFKSLISELLEKIISFIVKNNTQLSTRFCCGLKLNYFIVFILKQTFSRKLFKPIQKAFFKRKFLLANIPSKFPIHAL